jgi:uncharacterized membrane protein
MNMKKVWAAPSRLYVRLRKLNIEALFLSIFIFFGLIFIVIVPPGWNTDETNHIYRIYQLSKGDLLSEQVMDNYAHVKAYGGNVSSNLVKLFDDTIVSEPGAVGNPNKKIGNVYRSRPEILKLSDSNKQESTHFSGAALYSPVSYAVYLPIFWLGNLLSLPFFWIIMVSRLAGLLVAGLAIFFAIKIIPAGKWILFAIALLPGIVVQSAAVGADSPELAACFLFTAFIVKFIYGSRKLRFWDFGIFFAVAMWLTLIKLAYAPLVLLLLALPLVKKDCRNRKDTVLLGLTLVLSLVPSLVWTHMVSYIDINSNPQANFAAQKMFVLHEPVTYLKTLYYTFFTNAQMSLNNITGSFIWDSAPLPAIYAYLGVVAVALSLFVKSFRESKIIKLTKKQLVVWRSAILAIVGITALLIATTLYIFSTTLHQSSIVGLQSRYFLPLLPLLLLGFYGNNARNQLSVKKAIVIMSVLVLIGTVLTICFRLYQAPPLIIS